MDAESIFHEGVARPALDRKYAVSSKGIFDLFIRKSTSIKCFWNSMRAFDKTMGTISIPDIGKVDEELQEPDAIVVPMKVLGFFRFGIAREGPPGLNAVDIGATAEITSRHTDEAFIERDVMQGFKGRSGRDVSHMGSVRRIRQSEHAPLRFPRILTFEPGNEFEELRRLVRGQISGQERDAVAHEVPVSLCFVPQGRGSPKRNKLGQPSTVVGMAHPFLNPVKGAREDAWNDALLLDLQLFDGHGPPHIRPLV